MFCILNALKVTTEKVKTIVVQQQKSAQSVNRPTLWLSMKDVDGAGAVGLVLRVDDDGVEHPASRAVLHGRGYTDALWWDVHLCAHAVLQTTLDHLRITPEENLDTSFYL